MITKNGRIISGVMATLVILLFAVPPLWGRGIYIDSVPRGATVRLVGHYTIVGRTPCFFARQLKGTYTVKAIRSGYEIWSSRTNFSGTGNDSLLIRLSPCTPVKAGLRSAIFPGWGQIYSDRRVRGAIVSSLFLGAVISSVVAEVDYRDKVDDYEYLAEQYRNVKNIGEIERFEQALLEKKEESDDAYSLRQTFIGITAALWLYNVVDAVLLFPSQRGGWLTMGPSSALGGVQLSLRF